MLVDTDDKYTDVLTQLERYNTLVVDVETNGLDPFGINQICGVGISTLEGDTHYFPVRHQQGTNLKYSHIQDLLSLLGSMDTLIGYNIKFDLRFLEKEGMKPQPNQTWVDVIVMVRLVEPSTVKDLDLTSTITRVFGAEHAAYDKETKKYLRSNKWNKDFSMAPPEVLGPYCEQDTYWTYKLYMEALNKINATQQTQIFEMECELTKVLYGIEGHGVSIDTQYVENAITKITKRTNEIAEKIYALVGNEFNINSTQQVGEILNSLGIQSPIKTPKDKDSWNEAALMQINHPLAGYIRQYRALGKLRSTYMEPYQDIEVMHTSYCNWGTLTGRLSSREPNLQNIPRTHFKLADMELTEQTKEALTSRINAQITAKGITHTLDLDDEVLKTWSFVGDEYYNEEDINQVSVRRLFIPREDYQLVSFDYSQMEVRVFLSYLKNPEVDAMLQSKDVDFHGEAAKIAFKITDEDDSFKFYRQMAKNITFGVIYGIGKAKLANQLNVSETDAMKYKKQYFDGIKGSRKFFNAVMNTVQERGWIKNRYGRVYSLPPDISYKGVNYLVEGTSADILNERMIQVYEYLKTTKSSILLQVHDEIICEVHRSELDTVPYEIQRLMETNSLDIPLRVDIDVCNPSWATKEALDDTPRALEDYIDWR